MRVKNYHIGLFLKTGTDKWTRVKMQDSIEITYDAQTTEENLIDDMESTTTLNSYKLSINGDLICSTNDAVFPYLDGLRKKRAVGEEAEGEVMVVYFYDEKATYDAQKKTGTAPAEMNKCSIQFSSFNAEGGGGNAKLSYNINFNGDPTFGTAAVTTDGVTFTASTESDEG